MSFFDWREDYSVGITGIDNQHRIIIGLMNDLFESLRDGREDYVIREVLDELGRYADYHFGLEAELFAKYHYVNSAEHLREHRLFIDRIDSLKRARAEQSPDVSLETLEYLRTWFSGHMLKVDKAYASYFESAAVIQEIESSLAKAET